VKRIGILAHSAEGAALCFLEACHEGERRLGAHFHPDIVLDIAAMGDSMDDWERRDFAPIAERFARAAERLAAAGADFWICPDNTAHLAFEAMTTPLPLPGLHIAEIVAEEAARRGFHKLGITGTTWTMEGPVYPAALARRGLAFAVPPPADRAAIQAMIFGELVRGIVADTARVRLAEAVSGLARQGCDAVVLGCTELPLLLDDATSPLPVLDSTRLLARAAVAVALGARPLPAWRAGPLA
jgi:aspartate racemase